jgi:hypothetical protein
MLGIPTGDNFSYLRVQKKTYKLTFGTNGFISSQVKVRNSKANNTLLLEYFLASTGSFKDVRSPKENLQ